VTALLADLRPGLGWLILTAVGVLLAGTALMLAVLPSSHRLITPAVIGQEQRADTFSSRRCPTPLATAFDDIGSGAGWFDVGPGGRVVISVDSSCTFPARRRLSAALVAGVTGAALVAVGIRRARPSEAR